MGRDNAVAVDPASLGHDRAAALSPAEALTEGAEFEPAEPLQALRFSRPVHSTSSATPPGGRRDGSWGGWRSVDLSPRVRHATHFRDGRHWRWCRPIAPPRVSRGAFDQGPHRLAHSDLLKLRGERVEGGDRGDRGELAIDAVEVGQHLRERLVGAHHRGAGAPPTPGAAASTPACRRGRSCRDLAAAAQPDGAPRPARRGCHHGGQAPDEHAHRRPRNR